MTDSLSSLSSVSKDSFKKVALVTGANSDIGAAIVETLLASEYLVYAHVNLKKNNLMKMGSNSGLRLIQQDLRQSAQARLLIEKVIEETSRLDVVVNTIGPFLTKELSELTLEEWDEQVHFNLNLPFYISHFAKDALIHSKGHIINFTFAGVEFLKSRIDSTAYCASKAGLVVLTKSLASFFAPFGVRVNAISPGLIEDGGTTSEVREKMKTEIPYGRVGTPMEIADVVRWVLIQSPQYLTGASIPVSGGWEYI